MTVYNRGDVVLVGFLFLRCISKKTPPRCRHSALRLTTVRDKRSSSPRSRAAPNAASSAIYLLAGWKGAGLLFRPLVTGIFRTIEQTMIDRKVGTMPKPDMQAIDLKLPPITWPVTIVHRNTLSLEGYRANLSPRTAVEEIRSDLHLENRQTIGLTIPPNVLARADGSSDDSAEY